MRAELVLEPRHRSAASSERSTSWRRKRSPASRLGVEARPAVAAGRGGLEQLAVMVEVEGAAHSTSTSISPAAASARSSASRFVSPDAIT